MITPTAKNLYRSILLLAAGLAQLNGYAELRVEVTQVESQEAFTSTRSYAGQTVPTRAADLGFKQAGEIAQVLVDVGSRVRRGDRLASLDTAQLDSQRAQALAQLKLAQAQLTAASAEADLAQRTADRLAKLIDAQHVSAQTYDDAKLAADARQAQQAVAEARVTQAQAALQGADVALREASVFAPFAGIVQSRLVDEGSQVVPGQSALRLVEDAAPEAHIGLPAKLAANIAPGDTYQVRWNQQNYPAKLTSVLPEVDPQTRTLTGVFRLEGAIPMGVSVELKLDQQVPTRGFWVPVTALSASDRGLWGVYVVNSQSEVERRLVEVVHSESERAFVRGTLSSADRIVKTGVHRLVPGQRVTI